MTGNQLVRKFIIRSRADWNLFFAFFMANIEGVIARGEALQLVVSIYKKKRSDESNAFMWAGLLKPISEQAWSGGVQYKDTIWNEFYKEEFLPEVNAKGMDKWMYLPNGNRRLMMSTTDLNTAEMNEYLNQVSAHATGELGVLLPVNPRDL